MRDATRHLRIFDADYGSCNGCEHELMLVSSPVVDMARYGLGIVSTPANPKRRRTHVWFAVYTIIVLAVFALSLIKQQWSVAATAFLIALVFVFATRWLWRRR